MPDLTRFSFCPAWHYHPTPEDAANCTGLYAAFGPIGKPRKNNKPKNLCIVPGCRSPKEKWSAYCKADRRIYEYASRRQRKYERARAGQW